MKFRKYPLMNKVDDETGAAGGAGAGNESGGADDTTGKENLGGDQDSTGKGEDAIAKIKAEYDARIEAMDAKNSELLNELKSSKSKLKEIEDNSKKAEMDKLEANGDLEKILEITKRELEGIKQELADKEEAEMSKREELLKEARVAEFKKRMGDVEFHDFDEAVKSVDLSKFIMEDSGWNEEGVKQAIEDFKTNKHYHFKSKKPDPNADAAGGKKHTKETDYQTFLKELAEE